MEKFNQSVINVIGQTPIVKLNKVTDELNTNIYVKLEYLNPGGSIKDRIGIFMLQKALERGEIKEGSTIIEGTSGNTGVGLAMFAATNNMKCIFVLADKQSQEKINNLRAFGAKVIVCPTNVEPEDPRSYYSVSARLAKKIPNSFFVSQYDNPDNALTHFETTGPEIFEQTNGTFDVFMAGVGTGGTLSGTGKYLKSKMENVKIVGVDCEGSILAHYHKTKEIIPAHPYVLEGIGEDFLPKNVHFEIIDDFVTVGDKESFLMTRRLLKEEAIYTGGSGGSAVVGAIKYAKNNPDAKNILVILPDSGNRYSSKIFNDDWMRDNGYLDSDFNVMIKEVLKSINKSNKTPLMLSEKTTVEEAITIMQKNDISQIPVCEDNQILGMVSEKTLLRPVFENKVSLKENVSVVLDQNFVTIDVNEMLINVSDALVHKKTVLITDQNKLVNILTDIDVLKFMSNNNI